MSRSTDFPCSKCGACCRNVGVLPESLRGGIIEPDENGVCKHLLPDNSCAVYETRPLTCRVDALRPAFIPTEAWHAINLRDCDRLHILTYGSPRVSLETK